MGREITKGEIKNDNSIITKTNILTKNIVTIFL